MLLRRRARHQPRTVDSKVTAPRRAPPSLGGNVTRRWQEAIRRAGDIGRPGSMFKLTVARDTSLTPLRLGSAHDDRPSLPWRCSGRLARFARKIRQALAQRLEPGPRIGPQAGETLRHGPQRELRRVQLAIEVLPRDRCRHGRTVARAGAERGDRGRTQSVAQPVDQDPAMAIRLPHGGQETDPAAPGSAFRRMRGRTASPHPNARPARAARRHADPCRRWCDRTTSVPAAAVDRACRARPSPHRRTRLPHRDRDRTPSGRGAADRPRSAPQACSSIAEICAMAISPSASSIARNGWPSASPWRTGEGNALRPCF